jgi:TetR/AcrR family fatty acid metabolism transcriptional regulator
MSVLKTARKRFSAEERREQVLKVAADVFSRKGYRVASVSDIVDGAGIGRGTFYLYFNSKKEVFLELIERYFSEFARILVENHKRLEEAIGTNVDVIKVWRENMVSILEYHRENPDLTSVVYRDALGADEDFSARVDELSRLARKQLVEEFSLLQRHGLIRPCDLDVVASTVMGASVYVIMEHVVRRSRRRIEELVDEMIEYHLRALGWAGAVVGEGRRGGASAKAKAKKWGR